MEEVVSPGINAEVLTTTLAARDFAPIAMTLLRGGETIRPVAEHEVVITAGRDSIDRVQNLLKKLANAEAAPRQEVELRTSLFVSGTAAGSVSTSTLSREEFLSAAARLGVEAADLGGIAIPNGLSLAGSASLPLNGPGQLSFPLGSYSLQIMQLDEDMNSVEVSIQLMRKMGNNTDTVLSHHFRATKGKSTVIGISSPAQTLVLVLQLKTPKY
jgi:hypothetical protein